MDNKNKVPLQIGVGVLVLIIFFAVVVYSKRNSDTANEMVSTTPTEETVNANTQSETTTEDVAYKNGTYTAEGTYTSPGGPEAITVSVTIANGVVTNTTVNPQADNPVSIKFQNDFVAGYKAFVVGKNINDLKLSKVSGSSLTPVGFNNALTKIKEQAAS